MRYLPHTTNDREQLLQEIGVTQVDELYSSVPKEILAKAKFNLPEHKSEIEVERIMSSYANQNLSTRDACFFIGAGCYNHHVPATVDYIIQRSEFLTSYTPYQPEIAQGTLTYLYEFQTMLCALTGQEVANASMYDGATAMAEAALMALRVNKKQNTIRIHADIHPQYKDVTKTYLDSFEGTKLEEFANLDASNICSDTAAIIIQTPDFKGNIHQISQLRKQCDEVGALLIVIINEIISLGVVNPPVEADIVAGEAQSIGVGMNYGGPHLGFFACRKKFVRQMPGRLCGQTVDEDGKRSFVLTLNTREQHIRREKATSNICTNQGLMALAFTVHMSLLGEEGFKNLATQNHYNARKLFHALQGVESVQTVNDSFFNEFTIKLRKKYSGGAKQLVKDLTKQNIIAGYALDDDHIILACTELTLDSDIDKLVEAFRNI